MIDIHLQQEDEEAMPTARGARGVAVAPCGFGGNHLILAA
jgi:hypothetical protein